MLSGEIKMDNESSSAVCDIEMAEPNIMEEVHEVTPCKNKVVQNEITEMDISSIGKLDYSKRDYTHFDREVLRKQVTQILTKATTTELDTLLKEDLYKLALSWNIANEIELSPLRKLNKSSLRSFIDEIQTEIND